MVYRTDFCTPMFTAALVTNMLLVHIVLWQMPKPSNLQKEEAFLGLPDLKLSLWSNQFQYLGQWNPIMVGTCGKANLLHLTAGWERNRLVEAVTRVPLPLRAHLPPPTNSINLGANI